MQAELQALEAALSNPARPVVAVVGGAKVSTKLDLLGNLVERVDTLVIGGGMANTFLAAHGPRRGPVAVRTRHGRHRPRDHDEGGGGGMRILLPADVVVAREFAQGAESEVTGAHACPPDAMILDAGPQAVARITAALDAAKTLIWNGPLGRVRDRALRCRHQRRRRARRRRSRDGRSSPWPAAAIPSRRSTAPGRRRISPISPPPGARSSNGWRARTCPASRASRRLTCGPRGRSVAR